MQRIKNHKLWTAALALFLLFMLVWNHDPKQNVLQHFAADQAAFERAARQVMEQGNRDNVACPEGVTSIHLYHGTSPNGRTVEFRFGSSGFGSETGYWGINYVERDEKVGFQGTRTEYWREEGNGTLFYEVESDNTCYVEKLAPCWYYYEAHF